ncbi:MAG TPA: hypothetical protein VFV98_18650 [Vicinamibacterales bacterium]|nr:hypothetical protein [Vicinamibacterales bacterium]
MPVATATPPRSRIISAPSSGVALDDLRSAVTFVRNDPSDVGQRQVFVRIDGGRRIALLFGESVEVEVQPGLHQFRIHNTLFWKHIRTGVEPGERLECRIVNSARWWTAGIVGVLGAAPLFLEVELRSRA